jgi:AcrR family transcriptional regulator
MSASPIRARRASHRPAPESRFDRRLSEILSHATDVFCDKGYEGASMRDLSRASGMSLAGLYHYFGSKERLLYLIQKHTFTTIVEELKKRLDGVIDPEQRIRIFIQNHLEYFVTNQSGLKVLAHEDEALKKGFNSEIATIKREYYRICLKLMEDLKRDHKLNFNSRTAVMSLFGMINWIYTWYNPRQDGTAKDLAQQMSAIVLSGVGCVTVHGEAAAKRRKNAAHGVSRGPE